MQPEKWFEFPANPHLPLYGFAFDFISKTQSLLIATWNYHLCIYTFTVYQDAIIAISISFRFIKLTASVVVKVTEDKGQGSLMYSYQLNGKKTTFNKNRQHSTVQEVQIMIKRQMSTKAVIPSRNIKRFGHLQGFQKFLTGLYNVVFKKIYFDA